MPALTFKLLGGFEAYAGATPLEGFISDKTRALICYLLVEADRSHRRDLLAGLFWPDVPEVAAHHSLSQAVYTLRRSLQSQAGWNPLIISPQAVQYRLDRRTWIDIVEFNLLLGACECHLHPDKLTCQPCQERLAKLVSLYHGDFCAGLYLDGCEDFEIWSAGQAETFRLKVFLALERLIETHLQLGDPSGALVYARKQVTLNPYDEESQRHIMHLLSQLGLRQEALLQYKHWHATLRREFNAEPEEATQQLYERIKAQ